MRLFLASLICPDSHRVVPCKPTSKMKKSACAAMSPGKRMGKPWVSNSTKHEIRYQAMLDTYEAAK